MQSEDILPLIAIAEILAIDDPGIRGGKNLRK